jgi:hypothetical protein
METFAPPRPLVDNPRFEEQRRAALAGLESARLDAPLTGLVAAFNRLGCCFTLQSCWGHFLYPGESDPRNLAPLPPPGKVGMVEYRIAYVALCIDNSPRGRALFGALRRVADIDPGRVQFGSADWFWTRQVNSYAIQVMPERFRNRDRARLELAEAREVERLRASMFDRLEQLLATLM